MNTKNQPASTFVTVDVEWATREQMICQIGLAVVRNGEITDHHQWLVRPPGNEYDETLYSRHHVRPEMTESAPTLEELWPEVQPYLLTGELWAHNAPSAETSAFRRSLGEYNMSAEWLTFNDSIGLFQRPDCNGGNGLAQCCMAMGIPFDEAAHHDALYDAETLAELLIHYREGYRPDWTEVPRSAEELRKSQQGKRVLRLGEFRNYYAEHPSGEEDVFAVLASTYDGAPEQVIDVFDKGDKMPGQNQGRVDSTRLNTSPGNPVNEKTVVPTGALLVNRDSLKKALKDMGAKPTSSISGKTYAVIVGTKNVGPKKLMEIEEEEAKGHHIFRIVGDADLDEFLYGDSHKFFGK